MPMLWQDIRYAFRRLRKSPGFVATAVVTLALGIGANAAIFSLFNGIILRPLPGQREGTLVRLYSTSRKPGGGYRMFSYSEFKTLREQSTSFARLSSFCWTNLGVREGDLYRRVSAAYVSSEYFDTFGVQTALGRSFDGDEERPGSAVSVAVLSHRLWGRLGADPDLVGKTVTVNGRPITVVGILPDMFAGASSMTNYDVWLPLGMVGAFSRTQRPGGESPLSRQDFRKLYIVGQLEPGHTCASIQSRLDVLSTHLGQAHPDIHADWRLVAAPPDPLTVSSRPGDELPIGMPLIACAVVSGAVLLIVCVNLANMFLARGMERHRDIAICHALGCSRARIIRQLMLEGLLVSIVGAGAGLMLAQAGTQFLSVAMARFTGGGCIVPVVTDWRLLIAMAGLCVLSTVLFALGPAWHLSRCQAIADMRGSMGSTPFGRRISHWFLAVGQTALTFVLVVVAGLFVSSAWNAAQADPGFSFEKGLVVELDLRHLGYGQEKGLEAYQRILRQLRTLPGVHAVSMGVTVPFGSAYMESAYRRSGSPSSDESRAACLSVFARTNIVGADYFEALGVPMLQGRDFTASEQQADAQTRAAIIDNVLAERLWPDANPVGQYLQEGDDRGHAMQIVGVVPHLRDAIIEHEANPHIYLPFGQHYSPDTCIHVRLDETAPEAKTMIPEIRRALQAVDPALPILGIRTWSQHLDMVSDQAFFIRAGAKVFAALGAMALVLAWSGLFGVKSYQVARRTREIGIRMALGATRRQILTQVVRDGMAATLAGLALGLGLALVTTRLLESLLCEVNGTDLIVLVVAGTALVTSTLLACAIPARRAARTHPMEALRYE